MGANIYTPEHRRLTALLRSMRENAGLTQVELAARLKRSQAFVSKYENGQRRLDLVELRKLAIVLGTSLPEIVARFEASLATARPSRRSIGRR